MKLLLKIARFLCIVILFCCGYVDYSQGITLRITCRVKGEELDLCKKDTEQWAKEYRKKHGKKVKVEIIKLPHSSNECFALYKQWLSADTSDIDIIQLDVAWIGIFSDYLAPLDEMYEKNEIPLDDYFDPIKECMFGNGRMLALPWYTDCGVIYYRKDLLEKYNMPVPKTWEELFEIALYIQNEERKNPAKKNKFYGFVFQAKAFEVLTCIFVEMVDSFGGAIVKDGVVVVGSKQAIASAIFLVNCLKNITSHSVLNYSEEDARGMFQSGNVVFMRNWPYAWALLNASEAVAGKVGVMSIPPSIKGGKSSGVLGGWFLAVLNVSKHVEIAADLIKFLTDKTRQRERTKKSYLPTFKSLYKDPEVLKNNPFFSLLYESLQNAVTRPSRDFGKNYTRASTEIFNTINTMLVESLEAQSDHGIVEKYIARLDKKLSGILKKEQTSVESARRETSSKK